MKRSTFIGIGNNPEGPELPLGFGMKLAQKPKAMQAFSEMNPAQKSEVINGIQGASTGDEALEKIEGAINQLENKGGF